MLCYTISYYNSILQLCRHVWEHRGAPSEVNVGQIEALPVASFALMLYLQLASYQNHRDTRKVERHLRAGCMSTLFCMRCDANLWLSGAMVYTYAP